ncbi:hypothetical protein ACTMSW_29320 [Micromonospora sp. BQ11]|uniref:hypothetical protein n=1 Tax=Micromonospora sp. BQ11 TaxID=3452212 RepID=UPI003F898627
MRQAHRRRGVGQLLLRQVAVQAQPSAGPSLSSHRRRLTRWTQAGSFLAELRSVTVGLRLPRPTPLRRTAVGDPSPNSGSCLTPRRPPP